MLNVSIDKGSNSCMNVGIKVVLIKNPILFLRKPDAFESSAFAFIWHYI